MKKILYALISASLVIGLMAGCESKEEKEQAKQAELFKQEQVQKAEQVAAAEALAEQKAAQRAAEEVKLAKERAKNPSMMNKMGVTMEEGKLVIDTNKAKEFFWTLQKNLDGIDKELQKGNLTAMKPAGIEVTQDKVSIDLNKTQSFFDGWGKQMEVFAREFDKMTKMLHNDTQIEGEEK
jgi:multidrug efflux pump subunit AcrA (membrane-fusion protein)